MAKRKAVHLMKAGGKKRRGGKRRAKRTAIK